MNSVLELPWCNGLDGVWVIVNRLLKIGHFIPCPRIIDALGLVKLVIQR